MNIILDNYLSISMEANIFLQLFPMHKSFSIRTHFLGIQYIL